MRIAPPISLAEVTRKQLQQQARGRSIPVRVALRSRIVLHLSEYENRTRFYAKTRIRPHPGEGHPRSRWPE